MNAIKNDLEVLVGKELASANRHDGSGMILRHKARQMDYTQNKGGQNGENSSNKQIPNRQSSL